MRNHKQKRPAAEVPAAGRSRIDRLLSEVEPGPPILVPAVFLDRDGTLIRVYNGRPANSVSEVELLPGVRDGCAELAGAGLKLIVVSNQGGLGHGYTTVEVVAAIQYKLQRLVPHLHAFYYCPHRVDAECGCRKPAPGMLLRAATEHAVDLHVSYMVGDDPKDMLAGVGAHLRQQHGVSSDRWKPNKWATASHQNFYQAVGAILRDFRSLRA